MSPEADRRTGRLRAVSLVCCEATLESIKATAAAFDHDYGLAVIYTALFQANLGWLLHDHDEPGDGRATSLDRRLLTDDSLRPVSVHALAGSLSLPYETTRRAVGRLVEQGFARRVSHSGVALALDRLDKSVFANAADRLAKAAVQASGRLQTEGLVSAGN
jgi:hypothetical protein